MKKNKQIFVLLLLVACCGTLVCCESKKKPGGDQTVNYDFGDGDLPGTKNPQTDSQEHLVTSSLHKISVNETAYNFIVNGTTSYKIIQENDSDAGKAVSFFIKTVEEATGVRLQIVDGTKISSWNENDTYLIFGRKDLFSSAGLSMPNENLGSEGYYIKTKGKSIFIMPNTSYGYSYAMSSLLRNLMGYEFISDDTHIFTKSGEKLLDLDIVEKPDFTLRYASDDPEVRMVTGGQTQTEIFMSVDGFPQHNCFKWLPPATYKDEHPSWYDPTCEQLCYTARGDKDEYDAMIETIMTKMKTLLNEHPSNRSVTITMNDNGTTCSCPTCMENYYLYGCHSASVIKFMNDVGYKVDEYLTQKAAKEGTTKREFDIVFFAYMNYETSPCHLIDNKYVPSRIIYKTDSSGVKIKDSNNEYIIDHYEYDESVVLRDNVAVYYAPIHAKYVESFYSASNEQYLETLKAWSAASKKLYLWLYETNFSNYFYPYNTYESCIETFRACASYSPYMIRCQTQENRTITNFGRFKDYIRYKAQFNANVSFKELFNTYFDNYFLEASSLMKQYFNELTIRYDYLKEYFPSYITGSIYENIGQSNFWPKQLLNHWMNIFNSAFKSIEMYKGANDELYEKLSDHLKVESLFPRYVLINDYHGYYSESELLKMKKEFKDDCTRFGVSQVKEGGSINNVWSSWGI